MLLKNWHVNNSIKHFCEARSVKAGGQYGHPAILLYRKYRFAVFLQYQESLPLKRIEQPTFLFFLVISFRKIQCSTGVAANAGKEEEAGAIMDEICKILTFNGFESIILIKITSGSFCKTKDMKPGGNGLWKITTVVICRKTNFLFDDCQLNVFLIS